MAASPPSLFHGKTMLAPMVRVCGLAFRVFCADNGADVVFTEELVAAKLAATRREVVQYPSVDGSIVEYVLYEQFRNQYKRTVVLALQCRRSGDMSGDETTEAGPSSSARPARVPTVVQLGVADGRVGAAAALHCCEDVDGIDLNMGCPKKFSICNGFGAALMNQTALAGEIMKHIYQALNSEEGRRRTGGRVVPVSIKTRLKGTATETATMLREMLIAAGHGPDTLVVHAITLHARSREQRSEQAPLYERAMEVVQLCRADKLFSGVCFVLNGSVASRRDGEEKRRRYGFDGVMLARSALNDATCFAASDKSAEEEESLTEAHYTRVMGQLLRYSMRFRTVFNNFKYHLSRAFPEVAQIKHYMPRVQLDFRQYSDCYDFFSLSPEERQFMKSCAYGLQLVECVPPLPTDVNCAPAPLNGSRVEAGEAEAELLSDEHSPKRQKREE